MVITVTTLGDRTVRTNSTTQIFNQQIVAAQSRNHGNQPEFVPASNRSPGQQPFFGPFLPRPVTPATQDETAEELPPSADPLFASPYDEMPGSPWHSYFPVAQESPLPAPGGQTEHVVAEGEDLDAVAARYGQKRDDLLLSNPHLRDEAPETGEVLIVLHDEEHPNIAGARLEVAREMAATDDPETLQNLVAEDIELATMTSPVPGDLLDELKTDLIARRPGDKAFEEMVHIEGELARSRWIAQGRTAAVFDPIMEAATAGDWEKVENLALQLFATYAKTTPDAAGIPKIGDMLITYGPQTARFEQAVREAEQEYLVHGPSRAADEVRTAYEQGGVYQGAKKLREVTGREVADPLTAALIFKQLEPTIGQIVEGYINTTWGPAMGEEVGGAISAAIDNASRANDPQVTSLTERIAAKFIEVGAIGAPYFAFVPGSVANGDGIVLPLEIAAQLRAAGRIDDSEHILGLVLDNIESVKDKSREPVRDFVKESTPLILPLQNANGYMREPTQAELQQWFDDHPEEVAAVNGTLERVNVAGYELARIMAALEQYQPRFVGSEHNARISENLSIVTQMGEDGAEDQYEPALVTALLLSEEGMIEAARDLNMEGSLNGEVYNPFTMVDEERGQVIADPSWPARMVRNHVQSQFVAWRTKGKTRGNKPTGVGLSLFGGGTYLWGIKSHGEEILGKVQANGVLPALFFEDGWRNLGFLGMYAAGVLIEGTQVISSKRREPKSEWSRKYFERHLRWFGWWNVAGTASYVAQGDWPRAIALGSAAGGTLWSTQLASWAHKKTPLSESWFGRKLKLVKWGGPVATGVTLLGSAAIWGIDQHERVQLSNLTEPYAADWYARMGVPPEIARHLGNNDKHGSDPFMRFEAIIEQTGMDRKAFMDWLIAGGEDFVGAFIEGAVHKVEPDEYGNFKLTDPEGDITVTPRQDNGGSVPVVGFTEDGRVIVNRGGVERTYAVEEVSVGRPRSIAGIVLWAELKGNPMPVPTP